MFCESITNLDLTMNQNYNIYLGCCQSLQCYILSRHHHMELMRNCTIVVKHPQFHSPIRLYSIYSKGTHTCIRNYYCFLPLFIASVRLVIMFTVLTVINHNIV